MTFSQTRIRDIVFRVPGRDARSPPDAAVLAHWWDRIPLTQELWEEMRARVEEILQPIGEVEGRRVIRWEDLAPLFIVKGEPTRVQLGGVGQSFTEVPLFVGISPARKLWEELGNPDLWREALEGLKRWWAAKAPS